MIKALETVARIAADLDAAGQLHERHNYLTTVKKDLDRMIKACEAEAIELNLAERRIDHYRETAPNKAEFVDMFGQDAWDATKRVSPVRKLHWLA